MRKWEYTQAVAAHEHVLEACQELGLQGWELATTLPVMLQPRISLAGAGPVPGVALIFKRPVVLNGEDAGLLDVAALPGR